MITERKPENRLEAAIEHLTAAYRVNSQRKQELRPQPKDKLVNKVQDTPHPRYWYPYKDD